MIGGLIGKRVALYVVCHVTRIGIYIYILYIPRQTHCQKEHDVSVRGWKYETENTHCSHDGILDDKSEQA